MVLGFLFPYWGSPSSSPSCYPSRSRSRSRSPSLVAAAPSASTGTFPSPSLCDSPSHASKAPCSVCSQYGTAPGQISFFRRLICRNAACPRYRPYVVVVRERTRDGIRNRLSPGAADRAYRIDAPFRDLEARRRSGDLSGFPRLGQPRVRFRRVRLFHAPRWSHLVLALPPLPPRAPHCYPLQVFQRQWPCLSA